MLLSLTKSVKLNNIWKYAGDEVEVEDNEAKRLIRLKAGNPVNNIEPKSFKEEPIEPNPTIDPEEGEPEESDVMLLAQIKGVSEELALRLVNAGFNTPQRAAEADPEDLIQIEGIGPKSVEKIQDSAEELSDSLDLDESDEEY